MMSHTENLPHEAKLPEFPEDFGLFINADGANPSVPWILKDHGKEGVFTEAAIEQILERCRPSFTLTAEDLRDLSMTLGHTLNPTALPLVYSVGKGHAQKLARQQVDDGAKHIRKSENEARLATDTLQQLAATSFSDHGPLRLTDVQRKLTAARDLLRDAAEQLIAITRSTTIYTAKFENRRHVPDIRRRLVVIHVRRFLQVTGNRYGFTTDTENSSRDFGLIEFLDIIVPHLTDPPSKLSPNTVARDVTACKNLKQDLDTEGE